MPFENIERLNYNKIKNKTNISLRDLKKEKIKNVIRLNPLITKKDILLNNGYSKNTAQHHSMGIPVLNEAIAEVKEEMRLAGITVDSVATDLHQLRSLAVEKGDISSAVRTAELKGKMIGAFIDRQEVAQVENPENQFLLSRLARLKTSNSN